MKTFKINEQFTIVCHWEKTRYGFRHLATLMDNGLIHTKAKACYYNRTWESFEYESVIRNLLNKARIMTKEETKSYMELLRKGEHEAIEKQFSFIGQIAKMGDILTDSKKEANDWKLRMIRAGLGEGIIMPDDWNELTEEEKEKRLNKIIEELKKKL